MTLLQDWMEKGFVEKIGEQKRKLTLAGITNEYQLYRVNLKCLYFNDKNDRIASWISQYKIDNNRNDFDKSNLEEYNRIIEEFIVKSDKNIKKTIQNIKSIGQQQFAICLNDGRIIDGNRRFCCLRELAKENKAFDWIETIIIDKKIENYEKDIKIMELTIQHGQEEKRDYNPIDKLVGIYNDIVKTKLLSVSEYANSVGKTESEISNDINVVKLIAEYLEFIGLREQFHIAREQMLDGPLRELNNSLKSIKDESLKNQYKYSVFTICCSKDKGDITRYIRKFGELRNDNSLFKETLNSMEPVIREVKNKLNNCSDISAKMELMKSEALEEEDSKIDNIIQKAKVKYKSNEIKERPEDLLKNAYQLISDVKTDIFIKLNFDQQEKIKEIINEIEYKLTNIKNKINF